VIVNSRGEPVRILGTVVDVTDTREQAQRRLSAVQRAAAIAEVAAELANTRQLEELADVALRGAQVLGAESSALAVFDSGGGPLRLHMTSRIVEAVRQSHGVELPLGGVEIELDDALPPQYAARHGRRVLLADRDEAEARFPAMADVHAILGPGAVAALPLRIEGRVLGSFVVVWSDRHAFAGDDLEVLEALTAQIALTVSRLLADAERATAVEAMADANRQLQLLADAGRVLSGTLDVDQQLEQLTSIVVPGLADWCWLMVLDDSGRPEQLATAHGDPVRGPELAALVRTMVTTLAEHRGLGVMTTPGRPTILAELDYDQMAAAMPGAAAQTALARLNPAAGAIVPLVAGGQTLGALGLFNGHARGPLSPSEVETAVEIGRRTGLALHHARLFGQQRALADALQRSMLTDPPQPEHCEIVVRYVPAAEGAEIGGDWYDAFLQPSGATVLAIGDVVGHDTRAAASMGQVRGLLRGISYARGGSPAEVLSELDRAVQGFALDTMATALVARLEPGDRRDGDPRKPALRPGQVLMHWASAGHPAPVVLGRDGVITVLDDVPADLLLGVSPDTHREDRAVVLDRGATVLLYTDGLVERRDRDVDAGTDELVKVLAECTELSLDDLCDRVLERLFLPDAEDDVALLAVRLT
jgi:serine phosphatase RsbU (regulator of sigma subunit)